jgi:hypothetical protein
LGIELFERAAEVNGCFLKAEQLLDVDADTDADTDEDPGRGPGYLLTFDVGRILIAADRKNARLVVRQIHSLDELTSIRLVPLDEEEPWWRLAGNPITRAWPCHEGFGAESAGEVSDLRMQFRADGERSHIISLRYDAGAVRVALHDHENQDEP